MSSIRRMPEGSGFRRIASKYTDHPAYGEEGNSMAGQARRFAPRSGSGSGKGSAHGGNGGNGLGRGPRDLLARADRSLMDAVGEDDPRERFQTAYLAALRGAAAILAANAASRPARERSRSAWVLLARTVPEFVMWADYFAEHSATRAALEAGMSRKVTERQADEFFDRVGAFLHDVEDLLGDDARLRPEPGWGSGVSA